MGSARSEEAYERWRQAEGRRHQKVALRSDVISFRDGDVMTFGSAFDVCGQFVSRPR